MSASQRTLMDLTTEEEKAYSPIVHRMQEAMLQQDPAQYYECMDESMRFQGKNHIKQDLSLPPQLQITFNSLSENERRLLITTFLAYDIKYPISQGFCRLHEVSKNLLRLHCGMLPSIKDKAAEFSSLIREVIAEDTYLQQQFVALNNTGGKIQKQSEFISATAGKSILPIIFSKMEKSSLSQGVDTSNTVKGFSIEEVSAIENAVKEILESIKFDVKFKAHVWEDAWYEMASPLRILCVNYGYIQRMNLNMSWDELSRAFDTAYAHIYIFDGKIVDRTDLVDSEGMTLLGYAAILDRTEELSVLLSEISGKENEAALVKMAYVHAIKYGAKTFPNQNCILK